MWPRVNPYTEPLEVILFHGWGGGVDQTLERLRWRMKGGRGKKEEGFKGIPSCVKGAM